MGAKEKKLTPEGELAKKMLKYHHFEYLSQKAAMEHYRDECVKHGVPYNQMGKVMGVTEASVRQMYKRRSERGPSVE